MRAAMMIHTASKSCQKGEGFGGRETEWATYGPCGGPSELDAEKKKKKKKKKKNYKIRAIL